MYINNETITALDRFTRCTGLEPKEVVLLHGTDCKRENKVLYILVRDEDGTLQRKARVIGAKDDIAFVKETMLSAGDGRVFKHIPKDYDPLEGLLMYAMKSEILCKNHTNRNS